MGTGRYTIALDSDMNIIVNGVVTKFIGYTSLINSAKQIKGTLDEILEYTVLGFNAHINNDNAIVINHRKVPEIPYESIKMQLMSGSTIQQAVLNTLLTANGKLPDGAIVIDKNALGSLNRLIYKNVGKSDAYKLLSKELHDKKLREARQQVLANRQKMIDKHENPKLGFEIAVNSEFDIVVNGKAIKFLCLKHLVSGLESTDVNIDDLFKRVLKLAHKYVDCLTRDIVVNNVPTGLKLPPDYSIDNAPNALLSALLTKWLGAESGNHNIDNCLPLSIEAIHKMRYTKLNNSTDVEEVRQLVSTANKRNTTGNDIPVEQKEFDLSHGYILDAIDRGKMIYKLIDPTKRDAGIWVNHDTVKILTFYGYIRGYKYCRNALQTSSGAKSTAKKVSADVDVVYNISNKNIADKNVYKYKVTRLVFNAQTNKLKYIELSAKNIRQEELHCKVEATEYFKRKDTQVYDISTDRFVKPLSQQQITIDIKDYWDLVAISEEIKGKGLQLRTNGFMGTVLTLCINSHLDYDVANKYFGNRIDISKE